MTDDALRRRIEYETRGLDESEVHPDPLVQFEEWFGHAAVHSDEANAMVLSTTGPSGPSSRAVLLRSFRDGAFVFYTNRNSRKGSDITADDRVSLLFPWFSLHRQVRIDGRATPVPEEVSDAYFAERPLEARAGAVASPQSQPIPSRRWLEERVSEVMERGDLSRPDHWGGYAVTPEMYEFWQGRRNRLHDRIRYRRDHGTWVVERLAP